MPEYEGPNQQSFDVCNATAAVDSHFNLQIHEAYGEKEVADIVGALAKVEAAYSATAAAHISEEIGAARL